jgi:hypothetical protein
MVQWQVKWWNLEANALGQIEVLSRYVSGRTEENHEKLNQGMKSSIFLDKTPSSHLKSAEVSGEHVASIFWVEK